MKRLPWLERDDPFPPTTAAFREPNGLLCAGGDLSPARLLDAYTRGIFPWYSAGEPILWWSPAPRCVIFPAQFHTSRSLQKRLRSGVFRVTGDCAFPTVMQACATVGERATSGTWITAEMFDAYCSMHTLGWAHSLEVWRGDELAGGLYGLAIGKVFFGESMFSRATDASKVALAFLCRALVQRGYRLLDCQVANPHLLSLGAQAIDRSTFETALREHARPATPVSVPEWRDTINALSTH